MQPARPIQLKSLRLKGRRIGLAMERGPREFPWVLDGIFRAEATSAGTIFYSISRAQIASNFKIWSSLRFKATDGELVPDWIASETLGISTMRSAGW